MDFKIVSNNKWGLKFVLYCLQNSVAVLYNIENDILTKEIETESNKFSSGIFASSEYLIHIDGNEQSLKVYNKENFQIVENIKIQLYSWKYNKSDSFILKNDQLFMRSTPYDASNSVIYDFSLPKDQWFKGKLQTYYYNCQNIFFPKKKIVYLFMQGNIFNPYNPVYAVYSTQFPIDKKYDIFNQDSSKINFGTGIFIEKRTQRQCNLVVFLEWQGDLRVWKNCPPYNQTFKYSSYLSERLLYNRNLFKSSDDKHIIAIYQYALFYLLQIRQIDDNFKIVRNITLKNRPLNADITINNLLVLLFDDQVSISSLNNQTESSSFGIKSIISFDSNDNLDILFVGQNQDSTPENPIHSLFVVDSSHRTLFQKNITQSFISFNTVALQKNGQKLLFSYKVTQTTNKLIVWDLVDNESLLETQVQGKVIKQISFLDENQLLLNVDGKISIMNLIEQQKVPHQMFDFTEFPNVSIYVVSNDGNLLAFVTDNSTVDIYDKLENQIGHIKLQQNETQIASLTFTSNNTLLVIDNQSVISSFSQSSCPHGFDNVDSYCLCLRQHANSETCECNNNFQEQADLTCQCLDPFILNQQKCECRQNQTQVNQTCQCKENFSLKGLECLCESPFIMKQDGTCQCPLNTTQNQNQCLCKENFIGSQGSCSCPEGFSFEQQKCFCPSTRYVWQKECIECSVWCVECTGSGFECFSFSWVFYCLIIGGGVVLVGIVFLVVKMIRKSNITAKSKGNVNKSQNNLSSKDLIDESLEKNQPLL